MMRHLMFLLFCCGLGYAIPSDIQVNQGSAGALLQAQQQQLNNTNKKATFKARVKPLKVTNNAFAKVKDIKFVLNKAIIINKTNKKSKLAITRKELESVFQPFYKKKITIAKLQSLVNKVSDKLLAKGFILSRAYLPQQKIHQGVVRINIVQGFISNYKISGLVGESNKQLIENMAKPLLAAKPLNNSQLEHALMLINKIPGLRVRAVLLPDKKVVNAALLNLMIEQKEAVIVAKAHNFGNKLQGREQGLVGVTVYNDSLNGEFSVWGSHSLLSNSSRSLMLSHSRMLGAKNGWLSLSMNFANSIPDYAAINLPSLDDTGRARNLALKYTYPLELKRNFSHFLDVELSSNNSKMTHSSGVALFDDRIRSIRVGTHIDFTDHFGNGQFLWAISQGINGLGANADIPSRVGGKLDYTKLSGWLSRSQVLLSDLKWLMNLNGQYSKNGLLAIEEFNAGGYGYDFGEVIGDSGLSLYNQLALQSFSGITAAGQTTVSFYVFNYLAHVVNNQSINQLNRASLASVGVGFKAWMGENWHLDMFVAKPLNHIVALEGNRNPRIFLSLVYNLGVNRQ